MQGGKSVLLTQSSTLTIKYNNPQNVLTLDEDPGFSVNFLSPGNLEESVAEWKDTPQHVMVRQQNNNFLSYLVLIRLKVQRLTFLSKCY